MRRRLALAGIVLVAALALAQLVGVVSHALQGEAPAAGAHVAAVPALLHPPGSQERDLDAYRGAGAWVDVFDLRAEGGAALTPASVDDMADAGVRTLYLQVARDDDPAREPGLDDPATAARFLVRAHERGLRVVGWYVPRFGDVDRDLEHLLAIADFEVLGHRFDGVAVDIEWTGTVADAAERSDRLVELSQRLRAAVGDAVLGAIVMPPVQLDVVNPAYWPGYPWDELAPLYDVWLPMGYWTDRTVASGYRHAATYTAENLERLRDHVGDDAAVHAIGGLAETTTAEDLAGFAATLAEHEVVGASIYDWATFSAEAQRGLSDALHP
jgi:hypothetical protein